MCLLLVGHVLLAQKSVLDSLYDQVERAETDTAEVLALLSLGEQLAVTDLKKAIEINERAKERSLQIGFERGFSRSLKRLGINYYFLGDYASALIYWQEAKTVYEKNGDKEGVANMLSNMGAIYYSQSDYSKALDLYLQALRIAEVTTDSLRIGTVFQNIGSVHLDQGNDSLALESFQKAVPFFEAVEENEGLGLALMSIGQIESNEKNFEESIRSLQKALEYLKTTPYFSSALRELGNSKLHASDFENGMEYLDSAYNVAERLGDKLKLTRALIVKADIYKNRGDTENALRYYNKAKLLFEEGDVGSLDLLNVANGLFTLYASVGDYKNAFENQKLYQKIKDRIYNIESDKKIDGLLFNFELEKKESAIELLMKDQKIQEVELNRQKGIRDGFIGGFILVLLFAGVFFVQRNRIGKEKAHSEELLLNILPEKTAKELKEKGRSDAQLINQVSVLFTDFKGFTAMSEQVTPTELVADLHACFSKFDHICEQYGIEKIKTIGDAYMAAGGLPSPNQTHATDVAKAALEMVQVVEQGKARKQSAGQPFFEVRIGIHTGPVVAGIVGIKKFQYDIWGDTVNTASRMESSGAVGQVNISQSTYNMLKDDPEFTFVNRGKIEAKGKGAVEMYFVFHSNEKRKSAFTGS